MDIHGMDIQMERLTDQPRDHFRIGAVNTINTITPQQLMLVLLVQQNQSQHLQYHGSNPACMHSLFWLTSS